MRRLRLVLGWFFFQILVLYLRFWNAEYPFFLKQWQIDTRNLRKIKFQDQLMNPQFGPTETAGIYRLILMV